MMGERYAVIMAGGKGERFWPLSTSQHPKQLLSLVGKRPFLAQAVERLEGLVPPERVWVVTNRDLVDATRAAVPEVPAEQIVGEPMGRDTAAAVACGGALIKARDPDGVFCILTADHVIGDLPLFRSTLRGAMDLAAGEDLLLTIGIEPSEPSTGFGYIEAGEPYAEREGVSFHRAARFVEKPDRATAGEYCASGRYCWNSGMFVWSVPALQRAFDEYRPQLSGLMDELSAAAEAGTLDEAMARTYPELEKISIDYALMEKASNIVMARGTFAWDDVGSWPAVRNHWAADEAGNTVQGTCETLDGGGNIVYSPDRLTALIGMEDTVVVQAEGVTLVCPRDRAQDVKKLVGKLREKQGYENLL
ncbi:mannose-1-phosphate guanylyltransferase [Kiritimatiella glycovorans]|nr:sugar phosphate nucleotidyltransferase [Kiritimatiella glycovorans]